MKIGETISLCKDNLKVVNADIVEEDNKIFMLKECGEKVLLANDAELQKKLNPYFNFDFDIQKGDDINLVWDKIRKKVYSTVIYVTAKCNMRCKICYRNFVHDTKELSLEDIENILKNNSSPHISFSGGECTVREDLPDMIRLAKKYNRKVWIITNGVRISNKKYLKTLVDSGLDGVHLSFDGFREDMYIKFRGVNLLTLKLKTLENLKEMNVETELNAVVDKDFNPEQVKEVLDYAKSNSFIKFVRFMALYEKEINTTQTDIWKLVAEATGKSINYITAQKRLFGWIRIGKMRIDDFFIFRGLQRPLGVFVSCIESPVNINLKQSVIFTESKGTPTTKDGKFSIQLMVGN